MSEPASEPWTQRERASVLFLVLDGMPVRHVGRRLTPALCGLAASGGWAPAGGRGVAVLAPLRAAVAEAPDLLVAHLNGPDTAGHVHGPDSAEAAAQYRATDAVLGLVLDALAPRWDDWLVIVVSDHDQEPVTVPEPVDLAAVLPGPMTADGGSALVAGPVEGVERVAGVGGHRPVAPDLSLVWTAPGRWFGHRSIPIKGVHGGPRQAAQVAVCGGGHPAVGPLAARLGVAGPAATEWAGLVAGVLGVPFPG